MSLDPTPSRRALLRAGFAALAVGAAGNLQVFGANSADRALVCIYLFGGNDSNSMIVPLDQFSTYSSVRGDLALPIDSLLSSRAATSQLDLGFHPALAELRDLFDARALAVVANIGAAARKPPLIDDSLAYLPEGCATPAWAMNLARGARAFSGFPKSLSPGPRGGTSLLSPDGPSGGQLAAAVQRSLRSSPTLRTQFPDTGLGRQLQQVVQVIAGAGLRQQIYLCELGGFATAAGKPDQQAALYRELSQAAAAFYQATVELGISQRVTTFTDTEFNRALRPDAKNNLAPAWGGHQMVLGGSVAGGDVYGKFPSLAPGSPDDATGAGVWIPGISKEQYSATFANWYGVDIATLQQLGLATSTLGFLA